MAASMRCPGARHRAYRLSDRAIVACEHQALSEALGAADSFVWVDIEATELGVLHQTLRELGVDLVVGHDVDEAAVLPRVFEHPSCMVCSLHEVGEPERHLEISDHLEAMSPSQLIMVLGERFIVTYHRELMPCVEYVKARSEAVFGFEGTGPSLIAYLLFQRCLYEYAHLNLANDNYLDRLQAGLRSEDFEELAGIIELAHANILTLKKMVSSLQIVLGRLTTMKTPYIDDDFRGRVLQLHKNAFPVRWSLDSSRQFLDGVIGGMQTAAANRMSEIATVLTIVSTIILPLTLITGIYGMNFDDIPEIHFRGGYFVCLAIMLAIVLCQVVVFHRLGWLRNVTRALRQLALSPQNARRKQGDAALSGAMVNNEN